MGLKFIVKGALLHLAFLKLVNGLSQQKFILLWLNILDNCTSFVMLFTDSFEK